MSRRALPALALLAGLATTPAMAQMACPGLPPRANPPAEVVPATVPGPWWQPRVQELERSLASADLTRVRLLFLGDSITQAWFPLIFQQFYGTRNAFNMGVGTDTTQGLLWRLNRSPLGAALKPELVVLLIGTNNAHNPNAADVALGVAENIRLIRQRSPGSRILLVGILPRGATPQDPFRASIARINALIAGCADNQHVFFADPGPLLLDGAGNLSDQVAYDRLHPTMVGYAILSTALEPQIRALLGK